MILNLNTESSYFGSKARVEFNGSCLNMYIAYKIIKRFNTGDYQTLENCLFAVSLTKNPYIDQYKYFGYGIRFNRHELFSHSSGGTVEM